MPPISDDSPPESTPAPESESGSKSKAQPPQPQPQPRSIAADRHGSPASVRIDKWLWSVRLYKTRSLAANACRCGHVRIDGHPVKASRDVRPGTVIVARTGSIQRTVRVRAVLEDRVGAGRVPEYMEDLTPPEELRKQQDPTSGIPAWRAPGSGRPTKKERRLLDAFLDHPDD